MLELLDEESTTVTPQVSKPVFRQRKTLGKKRQRDDDKNDIEETSGKLKMVRPKKTKKTKLTNPKRTFKS